MSATTSHLLEEFERLTPADQREFSDLIVHRAVRLGYSEVTDEELTVSAAYLFTMIDDEEGVLTRQGLAV